MLGVAGGGASVSELLSAGDVARMLGVKTAWVYEQSLHGTIPTVTLGRYRRYRRESIERWVIELEQRGEDRRSRRYVA